MHIVSTAKYKLVINKKLDTVRIVCAFNVYNQINDQGQVVTRFPAQSKCAYVSGDLMPADVEPTLALIADKLKANIVQAA
jgi:hypothetical protein